MRRLVLPAALLTLFAGLAVCQTTIPFRLIDNRIVAPVMINGKGPFQCIVDTGAGSLVSADVAKALGEQVALSETGGGVGEKQVLGGSLSLRSVKFAPGVEFRDIGTRVIPFDDMLHVFGKAKIDAIFGTPLFEQYVVTVDYDQRQLTLVENGKGSAPMVGTTLRIERQGIPVVSAKLDGVPARFGLDLGARSALLLYTPFVEKNGIRAKYKAGFETITGWGIGGPVRSQIARAQSLQLGDVDVRSIVIRLSTQKSGATTGSHFDGLIGPDVFRQFRTTFDYANNRVVLQKGPQFGKPDSYDRLGAWLGQQGDAFVVLDVIAGGPADQAGLHKGDLVIAIDGRKTADLLLPDERARMRTLAPGTAIQLELRHGSQPIKVKAVLRDIV